MTKQNIGILILTSIVVLLPVLAGFFLWEQLPEQIPIHWSLMGEIDQHVPKLVAIVVCPLVMLVLHWISFFSKRERGAIFYWVIPVIPLVVFAVVYYFSMT